MAVWIRIPAGTTGVRGGSAERHAGDNRWYLIGVAVRRAGGPLGQLVILSDDPAVPRVEKTFQPDPGTLDTGQNVVLAGNYRGCLDELMISQTAGGTTTTSAGCGRTPSTA